jgi:CheY-like chemotaxis protein
VSVAKVLIIDDTDTVRRTIKAMLFDFDCEFSEASNGAEALALLSTTSPDVIFLDLKLPDLSGIEVLRTAREHGWIHGNVIVVTGYPDLESRREVLNLGIFHYLTKTPLEFEELRAAFTKATGQTSADEERIVNPRARRLRSQNTRAPRRKQTHDGRPHLLVLDDQPVWLNQIADVLENDFRLTLTTSGQEALRHVRKTGFDLVVLDLRLPATNGFEVLKKMRRIIPNLKAVILAADPDAEDLFNSGKLALAFVPKGKLESLNDIIQGLLARGPAAQVFLSYDRRDKLKVDRLYDRLVSAGHAPWMDTKKLVGGMEWRMEIRKAINRADYFVFCATRRALLKPGMMHKELAQGLERVKEMPPGRNFFVTVRLEKCDIPPPYDEFQFVDYFQPNGFVSLLRALDHFSTHRI